MPTKTTKKSVRKVSAKKDVCPCSCGLDCPCMHGGECACRGGDSVKYTGIWAAWRAFWRRGFTEWAGTSSRSEYWLAWVANMCVLLLGALVLSLVAGIEFALKAPLVLTSVFGVVFIAYLIAMIIPSISMMTRRMHDSGLSAWLWIVYGLSIVPEYVGNALVYSTGIGILIALLPTQTKGNLYHMHNK